MEFVSSTSSMESIPPYELLLKATLCIPISHYLLGAFFIFLVFMYNFLEIHFLQDLFTGFKGQPVRLTFNPSSLVYQFVASNCKILRSRYLSTPWLCSPHIQTAFLTFFGRPPAYKYTRQLFKLDDGGTIALDWLLHTDVMKPGVQEDIAMTAEGKIPIVIVIPGLTSDSDSPYVRHLVFKMAKSGWNVVVSNHRGLGGVSITSDCFYNAGWTEDIRKVIEHIHGQHPEAPLFIVGTSIGANILVKYLGEEGVSSPIIGAAAICSPWDLLIGDRFIRRRLVQIVYDKALTFGLKGTRVFTPSLQIGKALQSHVLCGTLTIMLLVLLESLRLWTHTTGGAAVLVLWLMLWYLFYASVAIDDPVCTKEAIPWDECRANKNIILATTQHGGHLAYFEGITAKSVWWVRAVEEFFSSLNSSPLIHRKKEMEVSSTGS